MACSRPWTLSSIFEVSIPFVGTRVSTPQRLIKALFAEGPQHARAEQTGDERSVIRTSDATINIAGSVGDDCGASEMGGSRRQAQGDDGGNSMASLSENTVRVVSSLKQIQRGEVPDMESRIFRLGPSEFDELMAYLYRPEIRADVAVSGGAALRLDLEEAQASPLSNTDYELGAKILQQKLSFKFHPWLRQLAIMSQTELHNETKREIPSVLLASARQVLNEIDPAACSALFSNLKPTPDRELHYDYESDGDRSSTFEALASTGEFGQRTRSARRTNKGIKFDDGVEVRLKTRATMVDGTLSHVDLSKEHFPSLFVEIGFSTPCDPDESKGRQHLYTIP